MPYDAQKFLLLMKSSSSFVFPVLFGIIIIQKKSLPNWLMEFFTYVFLLDFYSFQYEIWVFDLLSVNFWLWFMVTQLHLLQVSIIFQQFFVTFPSWMILAALSNSFACICENLFLISCVLFHWSVCLYMVPHCFDYYVFVLSLEIGKSETSGFLLPAP